MQVAAFTGAAAAPRATARNEITYHGVTVWVPHGPNGQEVPQIRTAVIPDLYTSQGRAGIYRKVGFVDVLGTSRELSGRAWDER